MITQKPKKIVKNPNKPQEKSVGALLFSERTNADLLLIERFVLGVYVDIASYVNNASLLILGSQGVLISGKFFKSCSKAALFLRSGLAFYEAATSKAITYMTIKCNSSRGEGSTTLI